MAAARARQEKGKGELILQGTSHLNFINAIKSPATRISYENSLKRYMNHLKLTNIDDLLLNMERPKLIEAQLIDYIMSLRQDGIAYATIQVLIAPIFTFYQLNDVLLNRKKIHRYLGEYKRVVKDTAYSIQQIQQALQNADQRMRCVILLLSSTGCRLGALPTITLGNLTKLPDHGLYKVTFYEGTNNEYYSFTTREAAQTGIDNYLEYRKRCGEKLSFDHEMNRWEPSDSPLIRQQFDVADLLQVRHPKTMTTDSLRFVLRLHLVKSGLREVEHPTENIKRVRKNIALANGFRKHVISTFIEAQLNHEIRELLVDHATGLDASYFRPSEKQVLEEYLKAEPLLTISPSLRLQRENESLKQKDIDYNTVQQQMQYLENAVNHIMSILPDTKDVRLQMSKQKGLIEEAQKNHSELMDFLNKNKGKEIKIR